MGNSALAVQTYTVILGFSVAVNVLRLKAAGGRMCLAAAVKRPNGLRDRKKNPKQNKTWKTHGHLATSSEIHLRCSHVAAAAKTQKKSQPNQKTLQNPANNKTARWITHIKAALLSSPLTSISVKRLFCFSIPFIVGSLSLSFPPAAFNFKRTTVTLLLI